MIHDLKPYPAYKDSGVPWLGQVPAHWDLRSLGSLTSTISLRNCPDLPLLSAVRENARSQALVSLHQANLKSTRYGQMLLPGPPASEQVQISEYLCAWLKGLNGAVTAAQREVNLFVEYLIADVVTGKLEGLGEDGEAAEDGKLENVDEEAVA